ncbi:hypothetical protein D3C76_954590 [compost metagenome]
MGGVAHPADEVGREERGDAAQRADQGDAGGLGTGIEERRWQLPEHWQRGAGTHAGQRQASQYRHSLLGRQGGNGDAGSGHQQRHAQVPAAFAQAVAGAAAGQHEHAPGQVRHGAEQADTGVAAYPGAVNQAGHPEGQGVDRQHHRAIHRHQQPQRAAGENGAERGDRLALFFLAELGVQRGFL